MSKYINSKEALDTSLLLWDIRPTNTSIDRVFEANVYPSVGLSTVYEGPITFDIPPQMNGLLQDIEINVTVQVKNGVADLVNKEQISIVNNFANSLWSFVDVEFGDRIQLTQSMENAYTFTCFFNTLLNSSPDRKEYLLSTEGFLTEDVKNKKHAQCVSFFEDSTLTPPIEAKDILNKSAAKRGEIISNSKKANFVTKLHIPLLKNAKCLPTNVQIKVTLTKNRDALLLLAKDLNNYKVDITSIFLTCTYLQPRTEVLNLIEERLRQEASVYDSEYHEISKRILPLGVTEVTLHDIFPSKLPKVAYFVIQSAGDLTGKASTNIFTFNRFKKFQFFVDNREYFNKPLELRAGDKYHSIDIYRQLYKACGFEFRGSNLVNLDNIDIYNIVGLPLTRDREHLRHLNLQEKAATRIDLETEVAGTGVPFTLICFAVYDKLYSIDVNRQLKIIE